MSRRIVASPQRVRAESSGDVIFSCSIRERIEAIFKRRFREGSGIFFMGLYSSIVPTSVVSSSELRGEGLDEE